MFYPDVNHNLNNNVEKEEAGYQDITSNNVIGGNFSAVFNYNKEDMNTDAVHIMDVNNNEIQQKKIYDNKYPEKVKERIKKWRDNNKEKRRLYGIEWDKKNKDKRKTYKKNTDKGKIKVWKKNCYDRHRLNLTDYYIASVYLRSTVKDIPKELIEVKRAQIQLLRACKE